MRADLVPGGQFPALAPPDQGEVLRPLSELAAGIRWWSTSSEAGSVRRSGPGPGAARAGEPAVALSTTAGFVLSFYLATR